METVRPRFRNLAIFGWEAELPEPDEEALKKVRSDTAAQNLAARELIPRDEIKSRALALSQTFHDLIERAHMEEEVQQFLATYPELL